MWLQQLPNGTSLHDVILWIDGNGIPDRDNKTAYTEANISRGVKAHGGTTLIFNGTTSTIDTGSDMIGITDITFTAWIKMDSLGELSGGRIVDNGQFMIFNRSGGTLRSRSEPLNETSSITPPALGTWFHLALTRKSGTNGLTTWYIDGVQEGAADRDSGDPVSGDNVIIGAQTAGGALAYDGTLTNIIIFNKILTAEQIGQMHNKQRLS